jgi:hypothetical protein
VLLFSHAFLFGMLLLDPTKFPDTQGSQAGKVTNALQNILAQMVNERGKPPISRRSISTQYCPELEPGQYRGSCTPQAVLGNGGWQRWIPESQ